MATMTPWTGRLPQHRPGRTARVAEGRSTSARRASSGSTAPAACGSTSTRTPELHVSLFPFTLLFSYPTPSFRRFLLFYSSLHPKETEANGNGNGVAFRCPWPNCGREFNVNSNMRRHYRNHTTPGYNRGGVGANPPPIAPHPQSLSPPPQPHHPQHVHPQQHHQQQQQYTQYPAPPSPKTSKPQSRRRTASFTNPFAPRAHHTSPTLHRVAPASLSDESEYESESYSHRTRRRSYVDARGYDAKRSEEEEERDEMEEYKRWREARERERGYEGGGRPRASTASGIERGMARVSMHSPHAYYAHPPPPHSSHSSSHLHPRDYEREGHRERAYTTPSYARASQSPRHHPYPLPASHAHQTHRERAYSRASVRSSSGSPTPSPSPPLPSPPSRYTYESDRTMVGYSDDHARVEFDDKESVREYGRGEDSEEEGEGDGEEGGRYHPALIGIAGQEGVRVSTTLRPVSDERGRGPVTVRAW